MRALVVTPPGEPRLEDLQVPHLQPGEVRVDVRFAAVDAGDRLVSEGLYHDLGYVSRGTVGLGWDFVGVISEVTPGAPAEVGDMVVGVVDTFDKEIGSIAQQIAVPFNAFVHLPAGLDPVSAAVVPVGALTAYQAVSALGREPQMLLVTGAAGAVGGYVLSIARERGHTVSGLARESDRSFVESSGASFVGTLDSRFDAVIDAASLGSRAMAAVRDGGRYVGLLPGSEPSSTRGISVGAVTVQADADDLAAVIELVASGSMPARVAGVIALDEAPSAVARGVEPGSRGRLVVQV